MKLVIAWMMLALAAPAYAEIRIGGNRIKRDRSEPIAQIISAVCLYLKMNMFCIGGPRRGTNHQ